MARLTDDHIRWILDLDAKGIQGELNKLSSQSRQFVDDNRRMNIEIKAAEKQMKEAEKTMTRLSKAGLTNSTAFREAERTYQSASNEITSYRQRIAENTRALEENNQRHNQLIQTARVESLTMAQLEKRAESLASQLRNTSEAAEPGAYRALSDELNAVRSRMAELNNGSQSTFSIFKGGLAVLAGNLMTTAVAKIKEWTAAAIDWVKAGIEMAKGAEGVVSAFEKLNNSKHHLEEMRVATKNTISDLKLMEKAVRANEMGIGIEHMATLLQFAQLQAKKFKTDVDYMANSIVDGLSRQSTMILDNLGITTTQIQAKIKQTGDFTSAVIAVVNDRLREQGNEALTGAEKASQSATKWENAQLKIGRATQWMSEAWDKALGKMADTISELIDSTRPATEMFDEQISKVVDLETNIVPLIAQYEKLEANTNRNAEEQEKFNDIMAAISGSIPGVVKEFDEYGNILSINTDKVYAYIEAEKARLQFVNREQIDETNKLIALYQEKLNELLEIHNRGAEYIYDFELKKGSWNPLTKDRLKEIELGIDEYKTLLEGAQSQVKHMTGASLDDQIEAQQLSIEYQGKFREMTDDELEKWVKSSQISSDQYATNIKKSYATLLETVSATTSVWDKTKTYLQGLASMTQEYGDTNAYANEELRKLAETELLRRKNKLDQLDADKGPKETKEQKERKRLAQINADIEQKSKADILKIKKDYLDNEIKTDAQYNRRLLANQATTLTLRKEALQTFLENESLSPAVKKEVLNQITDIDNKMLDQQIKFQREIEKVILDANPLEKEKKAYDERLGSLGLFGVNRETLTAEQLASLELLEKQHLENINKINQDAEKNRIAEAEKTFEDNFKAKREEMQLELNTLMSASATNSTFNAEMEVHKQRMLMIQEESAARKSVGLETSKQLEKLGKVEAQMSNTIRKELEKRASQFQQYGNTVGQALGNVMSRQEDALKAFGDASIDIVFDILSQIIEAELIKVIASSTSAIMRATAESMATPQSALTFGSSGFATAAILTGAITAATMAAKVALKGLLGKKKESTSKTSNNSGKSTGAITVKQTGFAEGGYHIGYTGDGDKYDVKGFFPDGEPYHAGEYIIPQEKLSIPWVGTMVKQIDASIPDAVKKHALPQGFAEGGYHTPNSISTATNFGLDQTLVLRLTKVLENMDKNGVYSNISATEMQAQLNKLNNENARFTKKNR